MATIEVTLSAALKELVDRCAAEDGDESASEYVRESIRRDRVARAEQALGDMLRAGIESGPPVEAAETFWAERRRLVAQSVERSAR